MKAQNFYTTLGVSKSADSKEIQRAYRKLARKYHPDINKDEKAEAMFKQINEAYEVLKDPEKRKLYDTYGNNWDKVDPNAKESRGGYGGGAGGNRSYRGYSFTGEDFGDHVDLNDIFSNLFNRERAGEFDGGGGFQSFTSRKQPAQEAELSISIDEAVNGATRSITLQSYEMGTDGQFRPKSRKLSVKVPQGVVTGSVIRLAGQKGNEDLHLKITVEDDDRFHVDGHDLHTTIPVSPWEAVLGAKVPVNTVKGVVNLTIPKGSQSGRKLRLRGKGIPHRGSGAGDLIVNITIRVPDTLSAEEEKLFKELAKKSAFNPRAAKGQEATV